MKRVYSIEDANPNLFTTVYNMHPETGITCTAIFAIDVLKNQIIITGKLTINRIDSLINDSQTFELAKINLTPAIFQNVMKMGLNYNIDGATVKVFSYGSFNVASYYGANIFDSKGSFGYFVTAYEPTNSLCLNIKTSANGEKNSGAYVLISIPLNTLPSSYNA